VSVDGETTKQVFPLPNASIDLSGEVALVTGASSGLGARFARTLAAARAQVVLGGRRTERLESLVRDIRDSGFEAGYVTLDVTDAASISAALDTAESMFGMITVLVNSAGVPDAQRAHKMSTELIDLVLDTNLRGPYLMSCEVARRLIAAKKEGRIVNISSAGAYHYAGEGAALYSITKAAVNRMTEVLAVEWVRYGINVNGIAPGFFESEMTDGMIARIGDFRETLPRQRIGDPAQLDSSLLYLVSPSSDFVTGTTVRVDDGQVPR
jgi:NAD(P)-dependent dehydrogenase (short-subunit alcohol dehydrogenase family)